MIRLAIVIPTRNRLDLLLGSLETLRAQTANPAEFEILVVADGCTDGTERAITGLARTSAWADRVLRVISQEWAGAGAARDLGLRSADTPVVLFLDDDMEASPGLVAAHLDAHSEGEASVVLGRIEPEVGTHALSRQLALWWEDHYIRLSAALPGWTAFYTGNVSVSRDLALRVGGFDSGLDHGEDIELGYRLSEAGANFIYAPAALARTRNPKSPEGLLTDFYRSGRGNAHVYSKHRGSWLGLPLSAYGETNIRMRAARGILLRLSGGPAARLIDRCFATWASREAPSKVDRQMFEIARDLYYWRGVRDELPTREWKRLASPGVPILMYHRVEPRRAGRKERYAVTRGQFARQLWLLKLLGYRVATLEDLVGAWVRGVPAPPRALAITFDDGYCDNRKQAWPVLRRFGYPATLFLVAGLAGQHSAWDRHIRGSVRPLLTWEDVAILDREGFRIESHGWSHKDLTRLAPDKARDEVRLASDELARRLGRRPALFAYPYGRLSEETESLVESAGHTAAFSATPGLNTPRTGRFRLKRIEVRGDESLLRFALKVWAGEDLLSYLPGVPGLSRWGARRFDNR